MDQVGRREAEVRLPVLLALVLARTEINRRRKQDALKAQMNRGTSPATDSDPDESGSRDP